MAVTLGIMFQYDRGLAAAVPPPQPMIEATVISKSSQPISPVSQPSANTLKFSQKNPAPFYQTYNPRGEQKNVGGQTGVRLDIFA
ncbi:MAG: hypothetical protein R8M46_02135 [Ghiorsea sp.]